MRQHLVLIIRIFICLQWITGSHLVVNHNGLSCLLLDLFAWHSMWFRTHWHLIHMFHLSSGRLLCNDFVRWGLITWQGVIKVYIRSVLTKAWWLCNLLVILLTFIIWDSQECNFICVYFVVALEAIIIILRSLRIRNTRRLQITLSRFNWRKSILYQELIQLDKTCAKLGSLLIRLIFWFKREQLIQVRVEIHSKFLYGFIHLSKHLFVCLFFLFKYFEKAYEFLNLKWE